MYPYTTVFQGFKYKHFFIQLDVAKTTLKNINLELLSCILIPLFSKVLNISIFSYSSLRTILSSLSLRLMMF